MRVLYIFILIILYNTVNGQVYVQHGADVYLQQNSTLSAQGGFSSNDHIAGTGKISLTGNSAQSINMNGYSLPGLEVDNASGVILTGPLTINNLLNLNKGRLLLNGNHLDLAYNAMVASQGLAAIETDNGGVVHKKIDDNLTQFIVPMVSGKNYSRVLISTRGKYSNGFVNISSIGDANPNRPADAEEYLNNYWKVDRSGLNGDVDVTIDYSKFQDRKGNSVPLSAYYWRRDQWFDLNGQARGQGNYIRANITGDGGELFAMNIKKLTLYPNPATNITQLIVTSLVDEKATANIIDSRGRIVFSQSIALRKGLNQVKINVAGLARGPYSVRFISGGRQDILKLIRI